MKYISFILSLVLTGSAMAGESSPVPSVAPHALYPKPNSPDAISAKSRQQERLRLFHGIQKKTAAPPSGILTVLGITPGVSTVPDIEGLLGHSIPIITGDGASNEGSFCYRGKDGTTLVFTSDEISPGIGGLELYGTQDASGRSQCSVVEKISSQVSTGSGIHLGSTLTEVHKVLGTPAKKELNYEVYLWTSPLPGNCERAAFLILRVKTGHVRSLVIGNHESC